MFPVLFRLGPFTIYSFGLFLALGFLLSTFLIYRQAARWYLDKEKVFDTVFLSVIGGILGARLFYIIEHWDNYGFSILNWILVNARPGFSLLGGIGSFLSVFLLRVKKEKLPLYKMLDLLTVPILVFFIFGEIGAFFTGVEIGTPTRLPWGVIFFSTLKRHPVSLYKALTSVLILILIVRLKFFYTKKRLPQGSLFFTYVAIQAFLLFWIAFFEEDVIVILRIFKIDQLVYLILTVCAGIFLYKRIGRNFKSDLTNLLGTIRKT